MLQFKMSFPENFSNIYNELHQNEKTRLCLKAEGIDRDSLDLPMMSKEFFTNEHVSDVSIDANANVNSGKTHPLYVSELTKPFIKLENYYLIYRMIEKKYGEEDAKKIFKGIITSNYYLHDPTFVQIPYCIATTTSRLMFEGRTWGQLHSAVPKRAFSFMSQVIETVMNMSSQFAGAVAIGDVIVNLSYYIKKENLSDKEVENIFQNMVHIFNNEFARSGSQSAFTNISVFCRNNLKVLFDNYVYPDFSKIDIEHVMKIQKIFINFFSKGDPLSGKPYRFPVVTTAFLIDDKNKYKLDEDFFDFVAEKNLSKGVFNIYFSDDVGKIASCCRLTSDTKLVGADSFGNGGLNVGSLRVCTINLPRISIEADGDEIKFFNILKDRLNDTHKILLAHRELINKRAEIGFLPFVKPLDYVNIDKMMFSTVGIIGMYEMAELFFKNNIFDEDKNIKSEVIDFEMKVLKLINSETTKWKDEDKVNYNMEQVPGESLSPKFAYKDKILFGEEKQPYIWYSNQFIPLHIDVDIFKRMEYEGKFFKELSGGGICHINLNSPLKSKKDMKKIMNFAMEQGLQHFAINYDFAICEKGCVNIGKNGGKCLQCGGKIVDEISRVVGFFVPKSQMNKIRREYEFDSRKFK